MSSSPGNRFIDHQPLSRTARSKTANEKPRIVHRGTFAHDARQMMAMMASAVGARQRGGSGGEGQVRTEAAGSVDRTKKYSPSHRTYRQPPSKALIRTSTYLGT